METLDFVNGSIKKPYGKLIVKHKKDEKGNIITEYTAPKEIEIIICEDKNV